MSDRLPSPGAMSPQALEREYLACLLTPDGRRARALVEQGLSAGVPASTLYLRLIAPAMYEIGRMWETATISVAQEHLSTQITQAVIAALALHLSGGEPVGAGRVAAVSSSPGELHAIGAQMVGDFLDAQGWTVLALGANLPARELVELVRVREAALVALSTALPGHLLSVTPNLPAAATAAPPPVHRRRRARLPRGPRPGAGRRRRRLRR